MERIFIFIIIAVMSTLFNKNKNAKKAYKRPGDFEDQHVETRKAHTIEKPKTVQELHRGGLGDLIKELKTDFDDVFKEKHSAQKETDGSYQGNYEYKGYERSDQYQQEEMEYDLDEVDTRKKVVTSKEDTKVKTVYDNEIRDEAPNFNISFDEQAILQGIIMSEILGKPKALKR